MRNPETPPGAARRWARDPWLTALAPLAVALIAYLPNLDDWFVSDDFFLPVAQGYGLEQLTHQLFDPADPGMFFRPLAHAWMGLEHLVLNGHAWAMHVASVLLLGATAAMLGAVARRLTGDRTIALLAAVLFAAHPGHGEAVSWLAGKFDLVCGAFAVGCLLTHVRYAESGARRYLALSVLLGLGAMLAKEAALILPLAVLAYELIHAEPRRLARAVPLTVATALLVSYRLLHVGSGGYVRLSTGGDAHLPRLELDYLLELFTFPTYGLVTPVHQDLAGPLGLPLTLLLGGASLLLVVVALSRGRALTHQRTLLFAVALLAMSLLPPSSIFDTPVLVQGLEGSRYLYLASVGWCLLLAVLLVEASALRVARALGVVIVGLYVSLTFSQSRVWSHASELSRAAVVTMRGACGGLPGPEPTVLVYDAPDNYRAAPVFRNGIPQAVEGFVPRHPIGRFIRRVIEPDFEEGDGFDVRDYVGRADVCALRWDAASERLLDSTPALRAAPARSFIGEEVPRGAGPEWWRDWSLEGAVSERDAGARLILDAQGEDPQLAALVPLGARAVLVTMAVSPHGEVPDAFGELFWTIDDVPFSSPRAQRRVFVVHPDGEAHEYRLPIPIGSAEDLGGARLRLRIDPTTFPARITISRIELVIAPFGPPRGE